MSKSLLFFAIEMHINLMLSCWRHKHGTTFKWCREFLWWTPEVVSSCWVSVVSSHEELWWLFSVHFNITTSWNFTNSINEHFHNFSVRSWKFRSISSLATKMIRNFAPMNFVKILHCSKKHVLGVPRFNSNILLRNCSIAFQRAIIKQQIPCIKTPVEIKITTNPSHVIIQVPQ